MNSTYIYVCVVWEINTEFLTEKGGRAGFLDKANFVKFHEIKERSIYLMKNRNFTPKPRIFKNLIYTRENE